MESEKNYSLTVIPFGSDTPKLASAFLRVVNSYS